MSADRGSCGNCINFSNQYPDGREYPTVINREGLTVNEGVCQAKMGLIIGVVNDFNIEAIPYSILIDREGKIISKSLRSSELELKIREAIGKHS